MNWQSNTYEGKREATRRDHLLPGLTDKHGIGWTPAMLFNAFAGAACVGLFLASLLIAGKVLL
jgi:hypothetical protein